MRLGGGIGASESYFTLNVCMFFITNIMVDEVFLLHKKEDAMDSMVNNLLICYKSIMVLVFFVFLQMCEWNAYYAYLTNVWIIPPPPTKQICYPSKEISKMSSNERDILSVDGMSHRDTAYLESTRSLIMLGQHKVLNHTLPTCDNL